jgi:hypothetical protein
MKTYGHGIKINPRTDELRDFCNFLIELFQAGNTQSPISQFVEGVPSSNFFWSLMPVDGIEQSQWESIALKYSELSIKKY